MLRPSLKPAFAALAITTALPSAVFACACGCAVFDVGTATLLPSGPGGTFFIQYDFLNQTTNWSGGHSAPGKCRAQLVHGPADPLLRGIFADAEGHANVAQIASFEIA